MPDPAADGPVVVLTRREPTSYALVNALHRRFGDVHAVFESPAQWPLLRYRLKRLGPWTVAGQLLLVAWDRVWIRRRSDPAVRAALGAFDTSAPDGRIPTLDVASVNGAEVKDVLARLRPPVVVVSGTGLIRRPVLELAPTFLNIHCGLTPRYRGVHGGLWAVLDGHPEDAGTTVHVVDPGVDTGAVVDQRRIELDPGTDTYRTLVAKQYAVGIPAMVDAVAAARAGRLERRPPPGDHVASRQWFSPTLRDHHRFRRILRRGAGGAPGPPWHNAAPMPSEDPRRGA